MNSLIYGLNSEKTLRPASAEASELTSNMQAAAFLIVGSNRNGTRIFSSLSGRRLSATLWGSLTDQPRYVGEKLAQVKWFDLIAVKSFGQHRFAVVGHRRCRDRHYPYP